MAFAAARYQLIVDPTGVARSYEVPDTWPTITPLGGDPQKLATLCAQL